MIRTPIRRPILSFSASSAFSCAPFFIYLMFSVENIILRKVKKNSSRKCCTGWRSQSKSDSNLTQPFSYVSLIFLIYFNSNFNIYFFVFVINYCPQSSVLSLSLSEQWIRSNRILHPSLARVFTLLTTPRKLLRYLYPIFVLKLFFYVHNFCLNSEDIIMWF